MNAKGSEVALLELAQERREHRGVQLVPACRVVGVKAMLEQWGAEVGTGEEV